MDKSEVVLGLIEQRHRLISDDRVRIKKKKESCLENSGVELTAHYREIGEVGIINVTNLYGAICIKDHKRIDSVAKLEEWDDQHFYDKVGLAEKQCDRLRIKDLKMKGRGMKIPYHTLSVKPGRDVFLLLETKVLNHHLKKMGYNSTKEFNTKLLETISMKSRKRQRIRMYEANHES